MPRSFAARSRRDVISWRVFRMICSSITSSGIPRGTVTLSSGFSPGRIVEAAQEGGGLAMAKVLRGDDLMPGCNAVIEGKDEAEVIAKGAEHAKTVHKMTAIPPDMAVKVKAAIKDKR
jgi:predicted small metal-binding protein